LRFYIRNYIIGIFLFLFGLAIIFVNKAETIGMFGKVSAASGLLLAGWSGRQWWYYEKQRKVID
jgi:hypothetical protein